MKSCCVPKLPKLPKLSKLPKLLLAIGLFLPLASHADIKITVQSSNATLRELAVVYQTTVVPIQLDSTGCASVVIEDVEAVHARLFHGQAERQFFMQDGDSIVFTYNGADFTGTLTIGGTGDARVFRYLNTVSYSAPDEADYAREFADYKALVAEKEQAAERTFNAWHLERTAPRFATIERSRIHYGFAQNLMMYSVAHPYMAQLRGGGLQAADQFSEQATWEADYLTAVKADAVEHPELRELTDYRDYMKEAARILDTDAPADLSLYDRTLRKMTWLADNLQNDTLRETLINALAVEYVDQKGTDSIAELRNLQGAYVTLPALVRAFDRACAAHDVTAPGHPSPDFSATTLDGRTVSLKDFRGHYVYIDLWASWCGPCRMEFPHLRKLEAELGMKNEKLKMKNAAPQTSSDDDNAGIAFLGLSIDKDTVAWRRVATTLPGVQAHIGPDNDFLRAYRVSGIPRFILLDPHGRIVNADMTRPSAAETRELLEKLK